MLPRPKAPFPVRRAAGQTEGLPKYPQEGVQAQPVVHGVSSTPEKKRAGLVLAGSWALMAVSIAGIFGSPWVGALAASLGGLGYGVALLIDLARRE